MSEALQEKAASRRKESDMWDGACLFISSMLQESVFFFGDFGFTDVLHNMIFLLVWFELLIFLPISFRTFTEEPVNEDEVPENSDRSEASGKKSGL